ncbi:MAG: hypothetical protein NTW28_33770, partial [Candidatus Solibacter sp.]|nr:hypothetical protein [Candidatus Solibacter sp.]
MNFVRALAALASVSPLFAQYGGPAILARGQAPAAMAASQIDFRPYATVSGIYDSGLNGVSVDANGAPVNDASPGVSAGVGVSGLHSWKHTKIGLYYSGSFSHYSKSFYDGVTAQNLQLSITHQLSRHTVLSFNNNAALYGSNRTAPSLPQTVEFDPTTTYVPTNDFFDNRTLSFSSQGSIAVQRSTRTSVSVGGDGFLVRRRSTALFGVTGAGAHGDIQYRTSRRATVGAMYSFMHYTFKGIYSGTDSHTAAATYSLALSRSTQLSGIGGITRYENVFVQTVAIDPAIAALIGISSAQRVSYEAKIIPNLAFRLSKVVPSGTVFLFASHGLSPGNGLFLTSTSTIAGAGYNYSGARHWAVSTGASYNRSLSVGNVLGEYSSYAANLSVSRQVARATHLVASFNARKYASGDFKNYNKW